MPDEKLLKQNADVLLAIQQKWTLSGINIASSLMDCAWQCGTFAYLMLFSNPV